MLSLMSEYYISQLKCSRESGLSCDLINGKAKTKVCNSGFTICENAGKLAIFPAPKPRFLGLEIDKLIRVSCPISAYFYAILCALNCF